MLLVFRKNGRSWIINPVNLLESNLGHADKNKIVIDPFVGSGSLLVGAAYYGAHVMGADLDYNLVNAIGKIVFFKGFCRTKRMYLLLEVIY